MSPPDGVEGEFGVTAELLAEGTPRKLLRSYAESVGVVR